MRALIVDDHALIAQGVAIALEGEGIEADVTHGPTAADILDKAQDMKPDVVLLDLQLDGEIGSAVPLITPLRELGAQVLIVTGVTDRIDHAACLEAGAAGIAAKSEPFSELVEKVVRAARGERTLAHQEEYSLLDELHAHRIAERERLAPFTLLTRRETYVLGRLVAGVQADAIADESFVSIATVRSQIRSILQKLGVNSQLAAVAMARDARWIPERETVAS